jgi:hypothetical protein
MLRPAESMCESRRAGVGQAGIRRAAAAITNGRLLLLPALIDPPPRYLIRPTTPGP